MKKELFLKLEVAGVFVVFICGALLHFVYEWSEGNVCSILFGAVNESVWEHIKIFAMPYAAWSIIELAAASPYFKQFVAAKVIGLYALSIMIIAFFYLYTAFTGHSILWIDIISVFVWIALSFYISYKLTISYKDLRNWFSLAVFMLILYFAMYFGFTAAPPHIELFRDPVTGIYGIPQKGFDAGAVFLNDQMV